MIPKFIFKTSWHPKDSLPDEIKKVISITQKLNPEYEIKYFDDNDCLEFMKNYSEDVYNCYLKLKPGAFKADFWRYCILYLYGGVYSDIGHIPLISFDKIINGTSLVLVKEIKDYGIHNGLICCEPGNQLMKLAIDKCIENIKNNYYGNSDIEVTGPKMLGQIFENLCVGNLGIKLLQHHRHKKIVDISSKGGKVVINCKFPNYQEIMYPYNSLDYHILWNNKDIYNNYNGMFKEL